MERTSVLEIVENWKKAGLTIGFTSGVFDLLHYGHVDFLTKASKICDKLVVGINSDGSVKKYKDPNLPINASAHRAGIISSLRCVDAVFVFDERRNRKNLELLKPDFYIKAGDYDISQLTSRDVVEAYGGKAVIIKDIEGISTSSLIERIRNPKQKAVFLDRDGTINREVEYLHEPEKFEFLPNAVEGIIKFYNMGYRIIVITCQNGIGLGYFTKEDFFKVNKVLLGGLSEKEIKVDKIYFTTESNTKENPKKELIERAQRDLNLDLQNCVVIGDKEVDIELGSIFGFTSIGVRTGHGCRTAKLKPDYMASDLMDAADHIERAASLKI